MNTMLTRCSGGATPWSRRTVTIWPTISPAPRLRLTPSSAVKQNLQFTAHPTWLETQIVARCHRALVDAALDDASLEELSSAGRSDATPPSASDPPSISSPASLPAPLFRS